MALLACAAPASAQAVRLVGAVQWVSGARMQVITDAGGPVSYTHLTLPTIYSV